MEPLFNPFSPGAGSRPPDLAGRETVLAEANIALQRTKLKRSARSQVLLGLRGTGKTVLLNEIESYAEKDGHLTSFVEAAEAKPLAEMLYPLMRQTLRKLSTVEKARVGVRKGLAALRGFASVFKISVGDVELGVDPEPGIADSGDIELDLTDMFLSIGRAAEEAERAWTLLIDEIQYLQEPELAAVIVSVHRLNQKRLPVIVFAAGLPQIAKLSGEAKSYSERLFSYPTIGALDAENAAEAIRNPLLNEEADIEPDALSRIIEETRGYPFFLQEWGHHSWNVATTSPITIEDVSAASPMALARLDEGFFKVRMDQLTKAETDYVNAMASLGKGPYRTTDVADALGKTASALGLHRANTIRKGMIYSPSYGDVDFTVPLFDEFLRRRGKI